MNSNFTFLKSDFPALHEVCIEAEKNLYGAFRTTLIYCRMALEISLKTIYKMENIVVPQEDSIINMLKTREFIELFEEKERTLFDIVRKTGNMAVHPEKTLNSKDAELCLEVVHKLTSWIAYCYGNLSEELTFDINLVHKESPEAVEMKKLIEKLQKDKEEMERKIAKQSKPTEKREKEFKIEYISEAETRKRYIDLQLREVGWDISKPNYTEYQVFGMPKDDGSYTGIGFVDYVLWGDDGRPLAVIEAKKAMKNANEGQHQAKLYADCLEKMTGQRPIIFFTNGFETFIWDDLNYPPREVFGFYKKDELDFLIKQRTIKKSVDEARADIDPEIAGRPYQIRAITKVVENYGNKNRKSLLVMATGAGKTRTAISIVNTLTKSNWIRRVLFLADRTALVKQAQNNFKKLLPHLSQCNLVEAKENENSRIVFSTYQTMVGMIDNIKPDETREFGVGYFDLIIIDESHRSIYNKYGIIFEYFDAMLLGLTATPKSEIDFNTYKVFGLPNEEPTDSFTLEEAVPDYLVPPKARKIDLKFPDKGIKYNELTKEEQEEYENKFDNDDEEMPEEIEGTEINKWIFNKDTVRKMLEYLMNEGYKVEGGDKIGKTVIFAANENHADFIVNTFNEMYPFYNDYCQKITHKVNYAQDLINRFESKDKLPQIAVSVDMLDTGIDVPEILNLVMVKKIRSKTKFWQMIGRGTRKCPDIFGPGIDKQDFMLFDFCKNIEFFQAELENTEPLMQESITQNIFNKRVAIIKVLQEAEYMAKEAVKNYRKSIIEDINQEIKGIDKNSAFGKKARRYLEKYSNIEEFDYIDEVKQIELKEHISGLPFEDIKDDISAKKFDLLILTLQLNLLIAKNTKRQENSCIKIASNLKKMGSIPKVLENMEHIEKLGERDILISLHTLELEEIRINLRDLMKLLDKESNRTIFYTDFKDSIENESDIEMSFGKYDYMDYKSRLKKYLNENEEKLSIKKLKHNISLDYSDIDELEKLIFSEEIGGKEEFEKNFNEQYRKLSEMYGEKPFGILIRSMIGMDKKDVETAFGDFLYSGKFTGTQIELIQMIIEHYVHNGNFEPKQLMNTEFNSLHRDGITGLFQRDDILKLREIINGINGKAKI